MELLLHQVALSWSFPIVFLKSVALFIGKRKRHGHLAAKEQLQSSSHCAQQNKLGRRLCLCEEDIRRERH